MYFELDEKTLTKITEITGFTYTSKGNFIHTEDMLSIIEDLICEYDVLQEKYEDFKQNVEDNYVSRPMSDYTGDTYDDRF